LGINFLGGAYDDVNHFQFACQMEIIYNYRQWRSISTGRMNKWMWGSILSEKNPNFFFVGIDFNNPSMVLIIFSYP
jgi:hypothetical protein